MKQIYFAGGWFTPEQDEEHTRIATCITQFIARGNEIGIDEHIVLFNPRKQSLFDGYVDTDNISEKMTATLLQNVDAIRNSDIVVVITDRKDMGTIWEAGCAYAMNKPIIYYAETLGDNAFNLMLAKTGLVARNENELYDMLRNWRSWQFKTVVSQYTGKVE